MRYAPRTGPSEFGGLSRRVATLEREKGGVSSSGPGAYDAVILGSDDLVAYYRLGEDTGTTFADSSGGGNPLTVAAGTPNTYPLTRNVTGALVAGDDGAVEFNIPPGETAAQSYGEFLEDPDTTFGPSLSPMSACGWIKAKANSGVMADGVAFGTAGVVSGTPNYDTGWAFCVTWPARTLRLMRYDPDTSGISIDLGASLIADTWYFVCFTDDGVDHRLYVNAVEVGSDAPPYTPTTSTDRMRVGYGLRTHGSYNYRPFYGAVDEVAIWSRALPMAEIETIYASGVQAAGPVVGAGAEDTAAWMPLTTVTGGVPDLVWDASDNLIPTFTIF